MSLVFAGLSAKGQSIQYYQNDTLGFKFQYPSEWKGLLFPNDTGVTFDFQGTAQSNIGINNVIVSVAKLPRGTTAYQYLRQYISQKQGIDYSTLKTNEITLSNLSAANATWNIKNENNQDKKVLTVFTVNQDRLYEIYYETNSEIFDRYLPGAENIIHTFAIMK